MSTPPICSRLEIRTPPAALPLTLDVAKAWLNIPAAITTWDTLISDMLLPQATELVEQYLGRKLITQELSMWIDRGLAREPWWDGVRVGSISQLTGWADEMALEWMPVQSVDEIYSYDDDGTPTLFDPAAYYSDTVDRNIWSRVILSEGAVWPSNTRRALALEFRYTAGYGPDSTAIPAGIREGLLRWVGYAFRHRGDCFVTDPSKCVIACGAKSALDQYRVKRI